jgi:4-hydroxy-3-methylbut-2-enyl diphosphate reductase
MTDIVVADHAGACYGVERALDLVAGALADSVPPVRTLGPLIHNPKVVEELSERGATVVDEVPSDGRGTLVIRSHGVVPDVIRTARERGMAVVDATCPYVMKAQHAAERLARDGYQVVVVGEPGHPEVEGIVGHAPGSHVVQTSQEARALGLTGRVGVVVQTTQSAERLSDVVSGLLPTAEELRVMNTICSATAERQGAASSLAARSDVMVVIGGRNSGNTTRLAEVCSRSCAHVHHVETADELEAAWFDVVSRIGLTAGASTPADQIDEVVARIALLLDEA